MLSLFEKFIIKCATKIAQKRPTVIELVQSSSEANYRAIQDMCEGLEHENNCIDDIINENLDKIESLQEENKLLLVQRKQNDQYIKKFRV